MDMSPANRREGYSLNEEEKNMLLIRGGYIKPITSPDIENGEILIGDDGRIAAIGQHLNVDSETPVYDASDAFITPGLVDAHTHLGMREQAIRWEGDDVNENIDPITPQIRGTDGINPRDEVFRLALNDGVTSVHVGPGSANVMGGTFAAIKLNPEPACPDSLRSVSFPIYQTATFAHSTIGHEQFNYTRQDNPTRLRLEETIAALEHGADAIAFASGMAAISAVFELFQPGDHILCSEDLYGGTTRLFNTISTKNGLRVDFIDTTRPETVRAALRPETRAIFLETPSNPMMNITDIRACAALAKEAQAMLIVDNTFLSPCFQQPLLLGADLVIHSGSKFLSGHNDAISGFAVAARQDLADRIRLIARTTGGMLSPFDSWLVLRGVKTLSVRMERAQENTLRLAAALQENPRVTRVYYPGLPEHPGYAVNAAQTRGFGSMLSFRVDSEATAVRALGSVRLITFAESLGGTESLLTYPLTQTHSDVPEDMRAHLGIDGTLLRLSVGLEAIDDLLADLEQALSGQTP